MTAASELAAAGFVTVNDGVLLLAADASVQLWPIGHFYEMRITVGGSNSVVSVVVPRNAIKLQANPHRSQLTGRARELSPWSEAAGRGHVQSRALRERRGAAMLG
jgi:hypothetical protein